MMQATNLLRTAGAGWALAVPLFRARILALTGWRRRGLAFAAGGASVLAMAPFHFFPVLWLTLPVLAFLIEAEPEEIASATPLTRWQRTKAHRCFAAAGAGWWFGFGYFFAGLVWVAEAFLVEARQFAVLIPLVISGLPALLATFWAAATAAARWPRLSGTTRVLALALTLGLAEYARGHVLTGLPWNVLGYALTQPLPLMQSAAYIGVYGLTLVAVLVFTLPMVLWAQARSGPPGRSYRLTALAVGALPLLAMFLLGSWRLASPPPPPAVAAKIRIVQPSVLQHEKWRPEHQERIFNDHLELSQTNPSGERDGMAGISHVVWPEAAMPFLPLEYPAALQAIGRILPPGAQVIAGALRADYAGEGASLRRVAIFNSLMVFGNEGQVVTQYDKIHLVPGGEYLPLQGLLEAIGLQQLTRMRGGFNSGPRPRPVLAIPGLPPATPLICYEAIFPAAVVQGAARPGVIVNVTNDGWFGNSTGPRQHYHQARVRAVEEGVPLLRAANNGISGAFDAQGRVLGSLGMNVRGTLDVQLPGALPPPPYARLRDLPFFAGLCLLLAMVAWRRGSGRA